MAMVTMFWFTTPTHATLHDRGGGLIYDDYLNITWLQDANYAKTSGYSSTGLMTWSTAMTWAADLNYGGYDDWRLPTTPGTIEGEMGYLFYNELGGAAGQSITVNHNSNYNLFINLQPNAYWFGTEYSGMNAWWFNFYDGMQSSVTESNSLFAWAVRSGDVSAPVPEPATMLLLGSGLIGMAGYGRKKFFKK
jgi:hypothetical protein